MPARDFDLSRRFCEATTHKDESIAALKLGSFNAVLQNRDVQEIAESCRLQILVGAVGEWWRRTDPAWLVEAFGVEPPKASEMQSWGMKVGVVFDPSGVLWHVAEAPF